MLSFRPFLTQDGKHAENDLYDCEFQRYQEIVLKHAVFVLHDVMSNYFYAPRSNDGGGVY